MHAELLAIGSELTNGQTVNSNAAYLARQLAGVGIPCRRQLAIPDEPRTIIQLLRESLGRAPLVITTGGLGPTFDDLTLEAISHATGRPLRRDPVIVRRIRTFYRRHHRRLNRLALRQALVPRGADALENPAGTAPGLWLQHGQSILIALPGVPREVRAIMEGGVLPRLRAAHRQPIRARVIRTIGMVELDIQAQLERMRIPPTVDVGLYPHLRAVDIRLTVTGEGRRSVTILDRLERALRRTLRAAVYGVDDQTLEAVIGAALTACGLTVAVAESCTGGLIAHRLTNVPGSSAYVRGGLVAYDNAIKMSMLGVPARLLRRHGAVSAPVATAMARGARAAMGADVGLATTGIAGPSGATARKPVGLVYLGLADADGAAAQRWHFHGDRLAVKEQAAQMALDWLRRRACRLPDAGLRRGPRA